MDQINNIRSTPLNVVTNQPTRKNSQSTGMINRNEFNSSFFFLRSSSENSSNDLEKTSTSSYSSPFEYHSNLFQFEVILLHSQRFDRISLSEC